MNNTESGNASKKPEKKKNQLVYSEQMISMEEQRFLHPKYHWTPSKKEVADVNDIKQEEKGNEDMKGDEDEDIDMDHIKEAKIEQNTNNVINNAVTVN